MASDMGKIAQLDEVTINQIAAGEVIERPVSVVKELIENSIDAGATAIDIRLQEGGIRSIQIRDNGHGISQDDLPLTIVRHATSKMHTLADIYKDPHMGFRGEAIASICHISRLSITSKTADEDAYSFDGNTVKKASHPVGTTLCVEHLFEQVPVRLNYLKRSQTEYQHCHDRIVSYALGYPHIDFTLHHNGVEQLNTTGVSQLTDLACVFFGKKLRHDLHDVSDTYANVTVSGCIASPHHHFPTRLRQFLMINGRPVKNAMIQKATTQAFQDVIVPNRHPLAILSIELPHSDVDINVHPQKLDVKFLHPKDVFTAVKNALKTALNQPHFSLSQKPAPPSASPVPLPPSPSTPMFAFTSPELPELSDERQPVLTATAPVPTVSFLQVFDTYIVFKTEAGLWLLDQHAVHERVLYEKFKQSLHDAPTLSQQLLASEVIDLGQDLFLSFDVHKTVLSDMGFEFEVFGSTQIILRAVPTLFSETPYTDLLVDLLTQLSTTGQSDLQATTLADLQLMSCKAAIKAGQRLHPDEIQALIQDFLASPNNFTCPHGRPLFVHYDKVDLEKLFKRR